MSTPIEILLDAVELTPCAAPSDISDGLLYATHAGVLKIGEVELDVAVLNTGERVLTAESVERFFDALQA